MSRVTLSASAALVLLLAACGGSSSSDGPTLDEQIENEIDDNNGVLDGQIITTPDGTRYVVDAIDPNAPGVSSGYLLVARLDSRGQPVEVVQAAAIGDAYVRPNTTGTFTYSGNNVAYIARANERASSALKARLGWNWISGTELVSSTAPPGPETAKRSR